MFKWGFFGLVLLTLLSCEMISNPQKTTQQITLDTILDLSTVDVYPLFETCQNFDSSTQNYCFEQTLKEELEERINEHVFEVYTEFNDTIYARIGFENTGKMYVKDLQLSELVKKEIPDFDTIFRDEVEKFPTFLQSSTKRGIPVHSVFTLPIIIKVKS
ncbi:hypothetical protein [Namhaeicola litoreus]|uniref:Lipoprotein n=1 Tax=Namhaeicola litoreus TaxID=1052145 RepID=A0ABW3XYP7_9FLAO